MIPYLTNNRAKQCVREDLLIRGFVAFHSQFVEDLSAIQRIQNKAISGLCKC